MSGIRVLILAIFLGIIVSPIVFGITIDIPQDYDTIQEGIDAANQGDIIMVADGTYSGPGFSNLDMQGKAITVSSVNGAEYCVITGNSGFKFKNDETESSLVTGITFSGGSKGLYIKDGSPTITDCIIEEMGSSGVECIDSQSSFQNCVFRNNNNSSNGGAAYVTSSDLEFLNCVFEGNSAEDHGGALYLSNSSAHMENCQFISNTSDESLSLEANGYGGAISASSDQLEIVNCQFIGNHAGKDGGALYLVKSAQISQCTFEDNSADHGGGIYCTKSCTVIIGGSVENQNYFNNNYAMAGSDIFSNKKAAVINAEYNHFAGYHRSDYYVTPQEFFSLENSVSDLEPVNQDVYVAPDGDDENDGLTIETPFKTIGQAMRLLAPNNTDPHTIHLAPGTYSTSQTGERIPVPLINGVSLRGQSADTVVLDAEGETCFLYGYMDLTNISDLAVKGATSKGLIFTQSIVHIQDCVFRENNLTGEWPENSSLGGAILAEASQLEITNSLFEENEATYTSTVRCSNSDTHDVICGLTMSDCIIQNNKSSGVSAYFSAGDSYVSITNCQVKDNTAGGIGCSADSTLISDCEILRNQASGLTLRGNWEVVRCVISENQGSGVYGDESSTTVLENCLISDNGGRNGVYLAGFLLFAGDHYITNCSIIRNGDSSSKSSGVSVVQPYMKGIVEVKNNIIWANSNKQIDMVGLNDTEVDVTNNCVMNGFPGSANIALDPMFIGNSDFHLRDVSPCIDAGLQSAAPDTDIEGNPRHQGGRVDIGAYEFNGWPQQARPYIEMTTRNPGPGDSVACTVDVWNPTTSTLVDYPLFVVLEIFGALYCGPSFSDMDYYDSSYPPGLTSLTILPEFTWPSGVGTIWGVNWYAAMTNPEMTQMYGHLDILTFGWHE